MHIQKVMKPKDAIRINSEKDIPDFLADTIRIDGEQIICLAAEGYSKAPLGSVIGFDRNAPTETGKGAWPLGEGSFMNNRRPSKAWTGYLFGMSVPGHNT